jgi:PelA/Pel-15E family pectate lyase
MARPIGAADRVRILAERGEEDSTIDNGATCTQLRYLARVASATGLERFREPIGHGLAFLLAAQYPNGGWPQFFPLREDYSRHITFNDGAMIGVMRLLRDVAGGDPPFGFVDAAARSAADRAIRRGLRAILDAQVRVRGRLTAWCAQHDEVTLEPRSARAYEPASLSGKESVEIVEYLMEIGRPDAEVVRSAEAAVAWLRAARIEGRRVERVAAPGPETGTDVVVKPDPGAALLWARFYEIGSDRPIFVGRDGIVRYDLSEIEQERRVNYSWLGPYAADLLGTLYPRWRSRVASGPASAAPRP